mmetsp:Transcript_13739/g.44825  ORF Transcript_13739/g.44825 Transcript_13739/m.44825 type:complete len:115 (-) Transcript_13739:79-423(-)
MLEEEYGGRDIDEVVRECYEASLPTGEMDPGAATKLREMVGVVVDFYCSAAPGDTTTLPALNPAWRKALHTACDDLLASARRVGHARPLRHDTDHSSGSSSKTKAIRLEIPEVG